MQGESEEIAPVWRRINSFLNSTLFFAWLLEKTLNVPLNNNCTCIHFPPWLSSKREHRHQWGYFRKYNRWQPITWGAATWVELRTSKVMNYSNWGSKPGRESESVCVCVCVCVCVYWSSSRECLQYRLDLSNLCFRLQTASLHCFSPIKGWESW